MFFSIAHTTDYQFSRAVFCEAHLMRFHPRSDGGQTTTRYQLTIDPQPAGVTHWLDLEGNVVAYVWFDGLHEKLHIEAVCEVETLRENPYDYLLTSQNNRLPPVYDEFELAGLAPALRRKQALGEVDPVRELAEQVRDEAGDEPSQVLNQLNSTLYERLEVIHRETGSPWPPAATLESGRGACRDLAVLLADACRALGLAARFVSGYQEGDREQDRRELHAWTEVYLPGAGWRGYDPTHNLLVTDRHVAVAASVDPARAAPVTGNYRGTGVEAVITSQLQIQVEEQRSAAAQHSYQRSG